MSRQRNRRQLTPEQLAAERDQWAEALARLDLGRRQAKDAGAAGRTGDQRRGTTRKSSANRTGARLARRGRSKDAPPPPAAFAEPPPVRIAQAAAALGRAARRNARRAS